MGGGDTGVMADYGGSPVVGNLFLFIYLFISFWGRRGGVYFAVEGAVGR